MVDPNEYSNWLQKNNDQPPPAPPPISYELNTSPDTKSSKEIEQMPESYFDRRHEALDENKQPTSSPSTQRMVPVSHVLANHPTNTTQQTQIAPKVSTLDKPSKVQQIFTQKRQLINPSKIAIIGGCAGGVIAALIILFML